MSLQGYYTAWKKQLATLLTGALVFGSFSAAFVPQASAAEAGTEITTSASKQAYDGSKPVTIDTYLKVNYTQNLDGATVVIEGFDKDKDKLLFTNTTKINGIYDDSNGVLKLTGNAEAKDYEKALKSVQFSTTSTDKTDRTIRFSLGSALPFINGHYYEYINNNNSPISWFDAKVAAEKRDYFGRKGYLVTITSAKENEFVTEKTQGLGWIGAIDIERGNGSLAPTTAINGDWRWVTGPEGLADGGNGLQFYKGYVGKNPTELNYANWAANEPNNYNNIEYVAHIYGPDSDKDLKGKWNDFPENNNVKGFIVEYGGMPKDDNIVISATKTIAFVDKTDLKKGIDDAEKLKEEDYAATSWLAFKQALDKARFVLANENSLQDEVQDALEALEKAKKGLLLQITEPNGNTVYVAKPEFKGTALPNAEVTIKLGNNVSKTVTADVYGNWSYIPETDLPDGKYPVEVTAVKGLVSATEKKEITVDTTKPNLTITEPSGSTVYTAKPQFKGKTVPEATVTVKLGNNVSKTVTADAYGNWSYIPETDLPDGDYTLEVTAKKGPLFNTVTKSFTVDTAKPDVTITEPSGNTAKPSFNGTVTPGSTLKVEIKDASGRVIDTPTITVNPDGTWSATPSGNLPDGTYTIELTATKDGKTSVQTRTFTVDTSKPDVTITEPSGNTAKPSFKGTVTPGSTLKVEIKDANGNVVDTPTVTVNPDGTWSATPSGNLPDGTYTIELTATKDGKTSVQRKTFTIDTVDRTGLNDLKLFDSYGNAVGLNPAFDRNTTSYVATVGSNVYSAAILPTTLDPDAKIEISINNGAWQTVGSGAKSDPLALNVGQNTIIVKVTDKAGVVKQYTLTVNRQSGSSGSRGRGPSGSTTSPTTNTTNVTSTANGTDASFATSKQTTSGDQKITSVQVDLDKLNESLAKGNGQKLVIHSPNTDDVQVDGLTAATIKQLADKDTTLEISNLLAIYPLPSKQLDIDAIAKKWDKATLDKIKVHIDIQRASKALIDSARSKAAAAKYEMLVDPVNLDLTFTYDGQTARAEQLKTYAAKYIALPEGIDPNRITTGVVVNPDGTVFHVPTVVTKINDRYFAKINDLRSHGTYSVIWNPQDLDDVKNHWGKTDINNIVARLILAGTGNNTFTPDRNVNRAEFAEMVVTGLGLKRQNVAKTTFKDVSASAWYHDGVAIADEFGIVLGFEDNAFHGTREITREQGIAMVARAYQLVEPKAALDQNRINSLLSSYKDASEISDWAEATTAQMIAAGIVNGSNSQSLSPKENMTRAEAAALIARMLKTTKLID